MTSVVEGDRHDAVMQGHLGRDQTRDRHRHAGESSRAHRGDLELILHERHERRLLEEPELAHGVREGVSLLRPQRIGVPGLLRGDELSSLEQP